MSFVHKFLQVLNTPFACTGSCVTLNYFDQTLGWDITQNRSHDDETYVEVGPTKWLRERDKMCPWSDNFIAFTEVADVIQHRGSGNLGLIGNLFNPNLLELQV